MSSLKKQTVSGVKWILGSSFLQKAISFTATIVLARILNPSIFGLFSLAFVAIDALGLFKSMGFDAAIIRRKADVEKAANTALFVIPILGLFLFIILSCLAPAIGRMFNDHQVVSVIRALGIIFVFSCFGKVPAAILERNMQFKKISIIEITGAVIYSITAIVLAISGIGIWSLVIAYVARSFYQNIMFWILSNWKPRFEFDKVMAIEMFHFGKFIFLGSLVYFLRMNLDNVLVGKLLGTAALGIYAIAFNIGNILTDYFSGKVERVVYPALSKRQDDDVALRRIYLEIIKNTSLIAMPFTMGVFLLRGELVNIIYGPKWSGVVPVLGILIWYGLIRNLVTFAGPLFMAKGKPQYGFWLASIQVALFVIFIGPAAKLFGLQGVACVVTVGVLLNTILVFILINKFIPFSIFDLFGALKNPLLGTILMSVLILILKFIVMALLPQGLFLLNFIFLLIFATLFYLFFLYKTERYLILELKTLFLR